MAVVFFTTVLLFSSCSKNRNESINGTVKHEGKFTSDSEAFSPGVSVIISNPIIVNSDTCPLPRNIIIPSSSKTITLNDGKLLKLDPPVTKPAGFLAVMQNYSTDNGLALDAISCAVMDKTGNIWFGTVGGGVSRYDGKSFTNFTALQGLASNIVQCITEDKAGSLWIGTNGGGVSRYDGRSFTNFTASQGLANNYVLSIAEDNIGNIWIGTRGGGVSCYDGKRVETIEEAMKKGELVSLAAQQGLKKINGILVKSFVNYTKAQGLANNSVWSIMQDKTGNIWFGTEGGVSRCDPSAKIKKGAGYFTNFTKASGLANNCVMSILEDKTGNIWFGTFEGGVSRYDGNRVDAVERGDKIAHGTQKDLKKINGKLVKSFTTYNSEQGLANNQVNSITEDKKGNIWFGTNGGGVSRYDPSAEVIIGAKSFINFTTAQGLDNNIVNSITEDKTGNLWFGTYGGGVSRYDGKSFINFTAAQGLANNIVRGILEDKIGNLWFATEKGVSRYDGNRVEAVEAGDKNAQLTQQDLKKINEKLIKTFTDFTTAQGLSDLSVISIAEDKIGNIWFGTHKGVCRYDGSRFQGIESSEEIVKGKQRGLKKANAKPDKTITAFTTAQGLANNNVRCIKEDKTGNIWFGTRGGGVSCYNGSRVEAIERGDKNAQGTQQDFKKTNGKLVKSFTNYTTAQGLAHNSVSCIMEDKTGNIWFGTEGGGLSRYDGNRIEAIEGSGLRGESIPQITQQDLKKTNGKLVKSFMNFSADQGLANNSVCSITEDIKENIWIGTEGGLSRFDGKSFTNFTAEHGLPDNYVTQVLITKEKNIAIGTNFGVAVLTGFSPISSGGKLHNQSLSRIEIASDLKSADRKDILPAENSLSNEELKNYIPIFEIYNSTTGYPVKDVNTGQNSMFSDSKGIIWISTGSDKTGLVRFDYASLNRNNKPPAVFIQNVKINKENICWYDLGGSKFKVQSSKLEQTDSTSKPPNVTEEVTTFGKVLSDAERMEMRRKFAGIKFDSIKKFYPVPENLVLPYRHNNVIIDFAAIEPAKPYLVRYQYLLEGYDEAWSPITNKTTAAFGNIYEGEYTFKLKAQSPFGLWSEPIEYKFTVLPPWWRTWWMYIIYGIAAAASVILIVWRNGRRLREKAEELTEEVRKATVTIVEKNKIVEEQKKAVEEKSEMLVNALKAITDSINYAKRIQRAMLPHRKDIWAAFPQSFVLFKPKDIVSGDFYFFHGSAQALKLGERGVSGNDSSAALVRAGTDFFIAAADCTGHGVPGAFMSMVGSGKLTDAVLESSDTSEILSILNKGIKTALKQTDSNESTRDGMDIALCSIDTESLILKFAGANRPIWIIRKGQTAVEEIKGTKTAIGGFTDDNQHFGTQEIKLQHGDAFYIFTDGYADQLGGKNGKKIMSKKFKEILLDIQSKTMKEQGQYLDNFVENWKSEAEQVDDILVIGIRV